MPVSPARLAAFEVLLKIETQDAYSSELLHSDRLDGLSSQDRHLCMELVMGVLRWRSWLDARIAHFSFTPLRKLDLEVLTALRLGAYQLEFLERVPARAAINDSVELVKHSRKASAAPLANAVLRKIANASNAKPAERAGRADVARAGVVTERQSVPVPLATEDAEERRPEEIARAFAHPCWLVERWIRHYGLARATSLCRFDQQVPATALRLRDSAVETELHKAGVELAPAALVRSARRLLQGDITRTRPWAEHRVVIQDEGSQLVAALVGSDERILDCCAAPGGKTAALADRNPQAQILAADLHEHRARLMRRLVRAPNVRIIAANALALPVSGLFDRILADVPCSGTGTLARNPEIKWRLRAEDLADLQARQIAILSAALAHLAPGGRLIYSTCSMEPEENEAVIEKVLASPMGSPSAPSIRIINARDELHELQCQGELIWDELESLTSGPYLRTMPGVHPCDGFFATILERL